VHRLHVFAGGDEREHGAGDEGAEDDLGAERFGEDDEEQHDGEGAADLEACGGVAEIVEPAADGLHAVHDAQAVKDEEDDEEDADQEDIEPEAV